MRVLGARGNDDLVEGLAIDEARAHCANARACAHVCDLGGERARHGDGAVRAAQEARAGEVRAVDEVERLTSGILSVTAVGVRRT